MFVILAILSGAALVWGLVLAVRGSVLTACLIYLVTVCCLGPYFLEFDVGMTLSLDRVFFLALVAMAVIQWKLGAGDPKPFLPVDYALFAYIAVLAASTAWTVLRGYDGEPPAIQHLINGYLIPLTIYLIARQSRLDERSLTRLTVGLAIFGGYLAIIGILEAAGMWAFVFPRYIADPEIGLHFGRSRGPMVQSVSFGVYLAVIFAAAWLLFARRELTPSLTLPALMRSLTLPALMAGLLAAVFFTKTRTVWAAVGATILLLLWCTTRGRVRSVAIAFILLMGAVGALARSDALTGLKREGTVADTKQSTQMRASFTYVSWRMFLDRPLVGVGVGRFADEKLPYLADRNVDLTLEHIREYVHHNTYLAILTEAGLVGFALLLAVQALWLRTAWALARDAQAPRWMRAHGVLAMATMAIAAIQMIGHEITFTPIDHSLIFLVMGVAAGLAAQRRRELAAASETAASRLTFRGYEFPVVCIGGGTP